MTDSTIFDDIRWDAEEGTPGNWWGDELDGRVCIDGSALDDVCAEIGNPADVSRIARVPELERIALAAEELAAKVEAWDAACDQGTGGAVEMCEMLVACADLRAAVDAKP